MSVRALKDDIAVFSYMHFLFKVEQVYDEEIWKTYCASCNI